MDENIVARKAGAIINNCLERLKRSSSTEPLLDKIPTESSDALITDVTELQQSFPFDVVNWDGTDMFPWADFWPNALDDVLDAREQ